MIQKPFSIENRGTPFLVPRERNNSKTHTSVTSNIPPKRVHPPFRQFPFQPKNNPWSQKENAS